MNAKWVTIVADFLVLIGLLILGSGWKGSANLTGAFPFHSSSVAFNGSASGAYALFGVPTLLVGLVLMVVSLVWNTVDALER